MDWAGARFPETAASTTFPSEVGVEHGRQERVEPWCSGGLGSGDARSTGWRRRGRGRIGEAVLGEAEACGGAAADAGESLEALSRELNVPAHRLSGWRDRVLLAGESVLKERERDARDDEIARLQAKVGEITMATELLYAKIDKLEAGRPLARGRSRR